MTTQTQQILQQSSNFPSSDIKTLFRGKEIHSIKRGTDHFERAFNRSVLLNIIRILSSLLRLLEHLHQKVWQLTVVEMVRQQKLKLLVKLQVQVL